jgi:hypothetical protein
LEIINPVTPEQVKATQDAKKKADEMIEASDKRADYLCHLKLVCYKYGTTRQECATAGNFDRCIQVKMGDRDFRSKAYARASGRSRFSVQNRNAGVSCSSVSDERGDCCVWI